MSDADASWWRDLFTSILQTSLAAAVVGLAVVVVRFFRSVLSMLSWSKRHQRWHRNRQENDEEASE